MTEPTIARAAAKAQGLKRYSTGKMCCGGHLSERFVSTGQCLECLRQWKATNRSDNREHHNEQARTYRAANAERYRLSTQRWQSTSRGRAVKARLQRERRARIHGMGGKHTAQDLAEILSAQSGRCAYCRADVRRCYEVDHIVSLAMGGSNDRRNIQIVCPSCNRRKRTKDPARFARDMGMLI